MGAHVWKRDGGTSAAKGVERDNEAGVTPGTATESAGTEAADAENPPPKRQRVEPPATSCQGPNTTGVPRNQFSSVAAPAAAAGGSEVAASSSNPSSRGPHKPPHAAAPGQPQQFSIHRGRGPARGPGFAGRGTGGRHPAAGIREDLSNGAEAGSGPSSTVPSSSAAGRGAGPAAVDRGRGTGRAGGRHQPGRGRGTGRHPGSTSFSSQQQQQQQSQAAAAAAEEARLAKQREIEALKAKIARQQAKADAEKAAQQLQQQLQQQQQELQQRKSRLNSAFGSAFANAAKARQEQKAAANTAGDASNGTQSNANTAEADEAEVKRVLSSKNDYDVLQLKPGCDKAALKKRYKEMAVRLHPDKCKAADASAAFQRANKAYVALQAHVL